MPRVFCLHLAIVVVFSLSCLAAAQSEASPAAQEALKQLSAWFANLNQPLPEPKQPEWIPLDPKLEKWIEQVLLYWEKRSGMIKTLECTFEQWEYDPQQIPHLVQKLQAAEKLDKLPFTKYASGVIKYAKPNKALGPRHLKSGAGFVRSNRKRQENTAWSSCRGAAVKLRTSNRS